MQMPRTRFTQFNISEKEPSGSFQTVEKAVRPQGIKDKETSIKNSHAGNKRKTFIENALRFLAFSVFALWRTPVRRRMQKRKIYLPFSTSASVSRLSRHAEISPRETGGYLFIGSDIRAKTLTQAFRAPRASAKTSSSPHRCRSATAP